MPSRVLARRIAALETCKVLHQAQELDDSLVPVGKESFRVHEEDEATLALDELDEAIPWDSSEPRPGTTKRRQYYYKRVGYQLATVVGGTSEFAALINEVGN
jgi:endoribonuclease Dicer